MNTKLYDALRSVGSDEGKAREAAKSVVQGKGDFAEIKASMLIVKWMLGFNIAFTIALIWRVFSA